jgi:hypothetical protein
VARHIGRATLSGVPGPARLGVGNDSDHLQSILQGSPSDPVAPGSWATAVRNRLRDRFGDKLPTHFERAMQAPGSKPYAYGDVSNVAYRKSVLHFNEPMPVPWRPYTPMAAHSRFRCSTAASDLNIERDWGRRHAGHAASFH